MLAQLCMDSTQRFAIQKALIFPLLQIFTSHRPHLGVWITLQVAIKVTDISVHSSRSPGFKNKFTGLLVAVIRIALYCRFGPSGQLRRVHEHSRSTHLDRCWEALPRIHRIGDRIDERISCRHKQLTDRIGYQTDSAWQGTGLLQFGLHAFKFPPLLYGRVIAGIVQLPHFHLVQILSRVFFHRRILRHGLLLQRVQFFRSVFFHRRILRDELLLHRIHLLGGKLHRPRHVGAQWRLQIARVSEGLSEQGHIFPFR